MKLLNTVGPTSWAESLPQNQFIIGLIEAVKLRSEGRKCDPCDKRGESTLAATWCENCGEAMCEDCENQHSSLKISRNHTLVDIASIKLQPIKSTLLRTPCQEHDGKFLDFYCEDHAQVGLSRYNSNYMDVIFNAFCLPCTLEKSSS